MDILIKKHVPTGNSKQTNWSFCLDRSQSCLKFGRETWPRPFFSMHELFFLFLSFPRTQLVLHCGPPPRPRAPPWTGSGGRIPPSPVASPRPSRHDGAPRPSAASRRGPSPTRALVAMDVAPPASSRPRTSPATTGTSPCRQLPSDHGPAPFRAPAHAPRPRANRHLPSHHGHMSPRLAPPPARQSK
ncbi:hypothetical protein BRADI_2g23641v3 [Brachypodium distachyon]|nr:hypothetical protein BRADI_2g23641v3 [Brachypodium distachyon]